MTNRVTDGFDWLPATDPGVATMNRLMAAAGYHAGGAMGISAANYGSASPVTGRFGFGKAVQLLRNYQFGELAYYVKPIGEYLTEGRSGFAYRIPVGSIGSQDLQVGDPIPRSVAIFTVWDAAFALPKFTVGFMAFGSIRVWRGLPIITGYGDWTTNVSNVILTTVSGVWKDDIFQYLDVSWGIDDTAGYIQVRINTKVVVDLVDIDTNPSGTAQYDAYGYGVANGYNEAVWIQIDDTYMNDTLGSTNNDLLGNVRVKTQLTVGDGSHLDFSIGGTSPAATNWQSVQNTAADAAKLVYAGAVSDYDLYDMDPNLNSPLVHVVQVRMIARQDDSTQRELSAKIRLSGVTYECPEFDYTDADFSHITVKWELNPDTLVSFTGAEVNSLEAGPWLKA